MNNATLIGAGAIVLWSMAATLTAIAGATPPFLLLATTFLVGGLVGLAYIVVSGRPLASAVATSWRAWGIGLWGLFGFHAAYFLALTSAPVAIANLINYLWPLLLVVFSGLGRTGPGGRRLAPLAGAMLGFCGVLTLAIGATEGLNVDAGFGYAMALLAAFIWASYSAASSRMPSVPTEAITGFCFATALMALPIHIVAEPRFAFPPLPDALAILALGLGPMGAAFFLWDHGLKKGDAALLGALAYATPVLSTGLLVLFGLTPMTPLLGFAALLVAAGAVVAARCRF